MKKGMVTEMELIVISDAKLKVMLSAEDVRRYELAGAAVDGENPETKRVLREILDEVKTRTGFDACGERVLVQLYPSRGGGCELFVTKLGKTIHQKEPGEVSVSQERRTAMYDLRPAVFAFDSLDDLLTVCRELYHAGYALLSTAYAADDGRYYLVLQERIRTGNLPSRLSFVEEYGKRRRGGGELSYIKEHSSCIAASDAVRRLAPLAM